jgi:hypothetical protein
MFIPVESENQVIGSIQFGTTPPPAYTRDDLRIGYLLALPLSVLSGFVV